MVLTNKKIQFILILFFIDNVTQLYSMANFIPSNKLVYIMTLIYRIFAVIVIARIFYKTAQK